ncbi:hypothetical protein RyT2_07660 [Pseudolactococcus yaeyamensis]
MKKRINELSKEINISNKILLEKAKELGFETIKTHSNKINFSQEFALRACFGDTKAFGRERKHNALMI